MRIKWLVNYANLILKFGLKNSLFGGPEKVFKRREFFNW
jgi:hypothetical protein